MQLAQTTTKPRLWVLEYGLFPRRVTIYLKEKGIADKFDIINVNIMPTGVQEESEGKPPGTLPILELSRPNRGKPGRYIFQSAAILEYLEDAYGSEGPEMRGKTPEARARVRECTDAISEATTWLTLYTTNGSIMYAQLREQKVDAAEEGLQLLHKALHLLERLAEPESRFLVGNSPTIADCVLMATFQFAEAVYGVVLGEKHPRLRKVVEAFDERGTAVFPEMPAMINAQGERMHVK